MPNLNQTSLPSYLPFPIPSSESLRVIAGTPTPAHSSS